MNNYYSEIKSGYETPITRDEYNKKIAKYKLHIKKHAAIWRDLGFNYVLISRVFKTGTGKTYGGIIDIKAFKKLQDLEKYAGNGIFNIYYL